MLAEDLRNLHHKCIIRHERLEIQAANRGRIGIAHAGYWDLMTNRNGVVMQWREITLIVWYAF